MVVFDHHHGLAVALVGELEQAHDVLAGGGEWARRQGQCPACGLCSLPGYDFAAGFEIQTLPALRSGVFFGVARCLRM